MPLPLDETLSLQGYSKPGQTVVSKPNSAYLVRLPPDLLDVLEAGVNAGQESSVSVDFDSTPPVSLRPTLLLVVCSLTRIVSQGFTVNGTFYPMNPLRETAPHDIFVRAMQKGKQNAPLKQTASVSGKFTVEASLARPNGAADRLRAQTREHEEARKQGKIQMLDDIPAQVSTTGAKRRPGSGTTARKTATAGHASLAPSGSNSALPSRVSSPLPAKAPSPAPEQTGLHSVRSRIVHCLAIQPMTADEVIKKVSPSPDAVKRAQLMTLINDVCIRCTRYMGCCTHRLDR
jgi:RNA polymerase II elongation factor ELL